MNGHDLRRYRAERLLRRQFSALRPRVSSLVRARLRARGIALDEGDLEQCYIQAWHGLYAALLAGEQIDDHAAWLVLVTFRRALEERRTLICRATELIDDPDRIASADLDGPDFAAELDRRTRLRHLFEALRSSLTARERQAVTLCYLHGLSRSQAAAHMGISHKRMRKLMDGQRGRPGVARKYAQLLDQLGTDDWCEHQSSIVHAYALGLLDPAGERHGLAVAHLRECPACRARVLCLRGLAAVLPPLPPPASGMLARHPRASIRALAPKTGALAPKVAATGALVFAAGGYVVLAGNAPGRGPHHEPPHAAMAVSRAPRTVPARTRPHHRAPAGGWSHVRRSAAPSQPLALSSTGQPRREPLGEFTPERPSR